MSEEEIQSIGAKAFFERKPPGEVFNVGGVISRDGIGRPELNLPDIELFCESEKCDGVRFFSGVYEFIGDGIYDQHTNDAFVQYTCKNCNAITKQYAISFKPTDNHKAIMLKIGEYPPFSPRTPTRVNKLIGEDRDNYFKGLRSESQGLGIGAFGYYRRVVENQKDRIIDAIIKVAEKTQAPADMIGDLKAAQKETQFSKAIKDIKHGIPEVLMINGHNPLALLHSALSEGLHAQTDEECLSLAGDIRTILSALAERIDQAMKDEAKIAGAVSRIMKAQSAKGQKS